MNKSYSDFMQEITAEELYDRLLQYGLFPEKLPPVFDMTDFIAYCKESGRKDFQNKWSSYISFNSMRNINIPRPMGIPTPMSHELLCKCLSDNWEHLQNHYKETTSNQKRIVSRIHIRKRSGVDALFEMNYKNWKTDGTPVPDISIGKRYVVMVDISNCFPSIYTHALSWALVGKDEAKKNSTDKTKWYNQIDLRAQRTKNGETHGLLIGPHTSNVLSEIILCSIDYELCKTWDYIRNIDDYSCFVNSRDEADEFLVDINRELRKYDLTLNHKKTFIEELPRANVENWVHQIQDKALYFEKFQSFVDYKEVQSFLDFCILLMAKNKDNASIMNYGLKILKKRNLTSNARSLLVKNAVSLSLIYPYLVPLLEECVFAPYSISSEITGEYINMIFDTYLPKNCYETCSYALYYAVLHDAQIEHFDLDEIINKSDCILLLFALIYCRKYKRKQDLRKLKDHAKQLKDSESMDEYWLFIYECLTVGLVSDDWKKIKKENVSFLKKEFQ